MFQLIPIMSFVLNLIILIVSACGFIKIMKNDLTHVQKSLDRIEERVNDIDNRLDKVAERVAKIEGRLK